MASDATIMAISDNMHLDARVIEVACIKYGSHLASKVAMASEAI